jgi:hypothetical protein
MDGVAMHVLKQRVEGQVDVATAFEQEDMPTALTHRGLQSLDDVYSQMVFEF